MALPLVILIGGGSSVGKTTNARFVGEHLGVPVLGADLGEPIAPVLDPLAGSVEIWDRPPETLCALLARAAEAAIPRIDAQVARCSAGAIIESERVHPALIEAMERSGRARGVLIIETDPERLYQTLLARSRGFRELSEARRRAVADVDARFGAWLRCEAAGRGLTAIESRPFTTLAARILASVTLERA